MADPVSLAAIGIGATAGGAGISALGNLFGGQSKSAMYNYQAGVAQTNANLAKQDANYAYATGGVEAQESGMRTRQVVGQEKAGFGAGNIDVSSGSAAKVVSGTIKVGQENQGIITANAAKRAYGFQVASAEDTAQAGAFYEAAHESRIGANIGVVSSIVGGAASVASKWSQAEQEFG